VQSSCEPLKLEGDMFIIHVHFIKPEYKDNLMTPIYILNPYNDNGNMQRTKNYR